jgi:MYXO-CTERM domain-containing protein
MMLSRVVIGVVLCAIGTVFILQGTNVVHGSGMSGHGKWADVGVAAVALGVVALALALRSRRRSRL